MQAAGYERDLIRFQLENRVGIFGCDDFTVYCSSTENLGEGPSGMVTTMAINPGTGQVGSLAVPGQTTTSWLNAMSFQEVWARVAQDGRFRYQQWTVKADPDAVFFPNRLKVHLLPYGSGAWYIRNCNQYPDVQMLGSLEVLSFGAVDSYALAAGNCKNSLPWQGWGEDYYLQHCLDTWDVVHIDDFSILGDARCNTLRPVDCSDPTAAAFHPFKTLDDYADCLARAGVLTSPPNMIPVVAQ